MQYLAVLDTETNWENRVMSIGIVVADLKRMEVCSSRYYILTPEAEIGGMYEQVLQLPPQDQQEIRSRRDAMAEIREWLEQYHIFGIYAYNACFDHRLLPELSGFRWFDIMRIAAYRQYNVRIPLSAPCCRTGRLRSQYGVEPMLRLLRGDSSYCETHNALYDAMDELSIMRLLGRDPQAYGCAEIG